MDEFPFDIPPTLARPRTLAIEPPHPSQRRRIALAAGFSLIWSIFALLAQFSGVLGELEEPLLDWRQALTTGASAPSDQLALVAIDQIPDDKPWPWSRLDYSLVLRSLIDYSPQSAVFEMNLNDRDTEYSSFDDTFSHIVERANTVIFASTVLVLSDGKPLPEPISTIPYRGDVGDVSRFGSALWPLQTFAGTSPVGANNMESESGRKLRRMPLVFMLGDKMIPSLVLQATAQFLGADLAASEAQMGRAIFLRRTDGRLLRTIPVDEQGRLRIRFHPGPVTSWEASFRNVLVYDDQLQHGIKPDHDLHSLNKRQVWIGRTDSGARERFITPIGELSRVQIELQAERTILDQDYVRPLPPMILAGLYLLIGLGGALMVIRFRPLRAGVLFVLFLAVWIMAALLAFRVYNVILPLPSMIMLLFGTFVMGVLALYWDLEPEEDPRQLPLEL